MKQKEYKRNKNVSGGIVQRGRRGGDAYGRHHKKDTIAESETAFVNDTAQSRTAEKEDKKG